MGKQAMAAIVRSSHGFIITRRKTGTAGAATAGVAASVGFMWHPGGKEISSLGSVPEPVSSTDFRWQSMCGMAHLARNGAIVSPRDRGRRAREGQGMDEPMPGERLGLSDL